LAIDQHGQEIARDLRELCERRIDHFAFVLKRNCRRNQHPFQLRRSGDDLAQRHEFRLDLLERIGGLCRFVERFGVDRRQSLVSSLIRHCVAPGPVRSARKLCLQFLLLSICCMASLINLRWSSGLTSRSMILVAIWAVSTTTFSRNSTTAASLASSISRL